MSNQTLVIFIYEVKEETVVITIGVKTGHRKCDIVQREIELESDTAMQIQLIDLSIPKPSNN